MGSIDFMLGKIDEGLTAVTEHYSDVKDADTLPDDLLYVIRNLVQDCQSALDWTTSDVYQRYVPNPRERSPYFPLAQDHDRFVTTLNGRLPTIIAKYPDIAAAFERHQPYQAGNEVLSYLERLSGENKHQQFSTQRLEVTEYVHPWVAAGGSFETIPLQYGPMVDRDGVPIPGKPWLPLPTITTITDIDWRFTNPDVSVMPTLQSLAAAVRNAVLDVRAAAGIQDMKERPLRVIHPRGVLRMGPGGAVGTSRRPTDEQGPER
jgi:hypothetical protein